MPHRILVVGSFVQDLNFATRRFPEPGETVVGTFLTGPGGKGSNQAVAARRAGGEVTFVGAVGDDPFGREVRRFYEAEGISFHLKEVKDRATGTAAILRDASAQNEIVVALGANDALLPEDVPESLWAKHGLLVCQCEIHRPTTRALLRRGAERGLTTILNPAPMPDDFSLEVLKQVDLLIPNETEFCSLLRQAGLDAPQASQLAASGEDRLVEWCRELGLERAILTLGAAGLFVMDGSRTRRLPVVPGIKAVDTTGAGDAFVGAFAAAFAANGEDLFAAAAFANAAAALSVTRPGTAPATPRREEIEALLARADTPR